MAVNNNQNQYDEEPPYVSPEELSYISQLERNPGKFEKGKIYIKDAAKRAGEAAKEEAKELAKEESKSYVKSKLLPSKEGYHFGDAYTEGGVNRVFKKYGKYLVPRSRRFGTTLFGLVIFAFASYIFFTISQGPLQFIHFAKYLEETHFYANHYFLNNRLGKAVIWAYHGDQTQNRNLTFIGNQLADVYQNRLTAAGIEPLYNQSQRIRAFKVDPNTPEGRKALQTFRESGIDVDSMLDGSNQPIEIDIDSPRDGMSSTRYRRLTIDSMIRTLNMNGFSAAAGARLLKLRAGVDFHPLKNLVRSADEDVNAYIKRVHDDFKKRIKYGVDATGRPRVATDEPEDGKQTDPEADDANKQISDTTNEAVDQIDPDASNSSRASSLRSKLTAGYGPVSLFSMVCAVQKIGEAAASLTYYNVNLPLIRLGSSTLTMGSQAQAGTDTNLQELGAMSEYLYNEEDGTSWTDARSIQANMGLEPTGVELPASAQPTMGNKPEFFNTVDSIVGTVPGGTQFCDAVTTTIGGWALTAIGIGLTSTGPVSALLSLGSELIQEYLATQFLDDVIAWIARDQVDLNTSGGEYGAMVDMGALLASNDTAISLGGTQLSTTQVRQLNEERLETLALQRQQQSIYERYLDPNNYHSFASTFAMQYLYPMNAVNSTNTFFNTASTLYGRLGNNLVNIFNPQTSAESELFDYGIPRYGFTQEEIDNPLFENPYENEVAVEKLGIARLNEEYGYACFNTIINPDTYKIETVSRDVDDEGNPLPATKSYDQIDPKCDDRNNLELTRYRIYIADTMAVLTSACYEGVEIEGREPCVEAGIINTALGGTSNSTSTGNGVVVPSGSWTKPIASGYRITSSFGWRVIKGETNFHYGVDLAVPHDTPYVAAKDGTVVSVEPESWGTNYIKIDHGDGVWTEYGHSYMDEIFVKPGDKVSAGEVIALVGSQYNADLGGYSSGPHLHFNVKLNTETRNNGYVDPVKFLSLQGITL